MILVDPAFAPGVEKLRPEARELLIETAFVAIAADRWSSRLRVRDVGQPECAHREAEPGVEIHLVGDDVGE
jgi:hypothetical protein